MASDTDPPWIKVAAGVESDDNAPLTRAEGDRDAIICCRPREDNLEGKKHLLRVTVSDGSEFGGVARLVPALLLGESGGCMTCSASIDDRGMLRHAGCRTRRRSTSNPGQTGESHTPPPGRPTSRQPTSVELLDRGRLSGSGLSVGSAEPLHSTGSWVVPTGTDADLERRVGSTGKPVPALVTPTPAAPPSWLPDPTS